MCVCVGGGGGGSEIVLTCFGDCKKRKRRCIVGVVFSNWLWRSDGHGNGPG